MNLSNVELNRNDTLRINKIKRERKYLENKRCYKEVENLYKLVVKLNITTKDISEMYNVSIRMVQSWLKELGLNRSLVKSKELIRKNKNVKIENVLQKHYLLDRIDIGEYEALIYRMVDINDTVLYVGQTSSSYNKDHNTTRKYTIKNRLYVHFYGNKRIIPVDIYKSVRKIDYILCSNDIVDSLEGSLILNYKLNGQCMWNGQFPVTITADINSLEWSNLIIFNNEEIELLQQLR